MDVTRWHPCSPEAPASSVLCWSVSVLSRAERMQLIPSSSPPQMQGCATPVRCRCTETWKWYIRELLKPRSIPKPKACISFMSINALEHIAWSGVDDSFRMHFFFFFSWSFWFLIEPEVSPQNTDIISDPLAAFPASISASQSQAKHGCFSTVNGLQNFII